MKSIILINSIFFVPKKILSYPADQMQDGNFSPAQSSQKTKKGKKDDKNKDKVSNVKFYCGYIAVEMCQIPLRFKMIFAQSHMQEGTPIQRALQ